MGKQCLKKSIGVLQNYLPHFVFMKFGRQDLSRVEKYAENVEKFLPNLGKVNYLTYLISALGRHLKNASCAPEMCAYLLILHPVLHPFS